MTKIEQYRQYAGECLRWAAEAKTEEERKPFLAMANDWAKAALQLEGSVGLEKADAPEEKAAV
jgi:hypothetical protein